MKSRRALLPFLVMAIAFLVGAQIGFAENLGSPTLFTDKTSYKAEEIVTLSGSGYAPMCTTYYVDEVRVRGGNILCEYYFLSDEFSGCAGAGENYCVNVTYCDALVIEGEVTAGSCSYQDLVDSMRSRGSGRIHCINVVCYNELVIEGVLEITDSCTIPGCLVIVGYLDSSYYIAITHDSKVVAKIYFDSRPEGLIPDGICWTIPLDAASGTHTATVYSNNDKIGEAPLATASFEVEGPVKPKTPKTIKQDVLVGLKALRKSLDPSVTDKDDLQRLDEAIIHLTKSLDTDLWVDEAHLQAKHGEKVFNEEKDAAVKLAELIKNKKSAFHQSPMVQDFINRLVNADRLLASVAIEEAVSANGDSKKNNKAKEELSKGDKRVVTCDFTSAIEHYRNAWKHAQ